MSEAIAATIIAAAALTGQWYLVRGFARDFGPEAAATITVGSTILGAVLRGVL